MAIENPTKYVSVQRLGRFEEKLAEKYATQENTYNKEEVNEAFGAVTDGAQAAELFTFWVDPDTMELKAASLMANLNCIKLEDGQLKLDLSVTSPSSSSSSSE